MSDTLASIADVCRCSEGQRYEDVNIYDRLADLIEPEPERTCHAERVFDADVHGMADTCSECGEVLDPDWLYCPHCGARVVGD